MSCGLENSEKCELTFPDFHGSVVLIQVITWKSKKGGEV